MENDKNEQIAGQAEQRALEHRQRVEAKRAAEIRGSAEHQSKMNSNQEALIKNIKETPESEKRDWVKSQMDRVRRLTPDEISRMRRDSAKETSISLEKQRGDRHQKNYQEFMDQFSSKNIEFKSSTHEDVKIANIKPLETSTTEWNEGQREFWHHHGNNREFYDSMAEKYPAIKEQLNRGRTLEDLKQNPELRQAVEFWWSKTDPVNLTQYKESYFVEQGFHRVTLATEHGFDDIPAAVTKAQLKR